MKRIITLLLAVTALAGCQKNGTGIVPDQTVLLYPEGQDAKIGLAEAGGPLENNGITDTEGMDPENGNLWNVGDQARFDLYFPEKPNGQMVIVCPGGGYVVLSTENEGSCVAEWLLDRGITVAVLKYRLPDGHDRIPLTDVQNTFSYCRAHAAEWGIKQIGIMGFSAGGHLAATASNLFTDKINRPDFTILLYPVITLEDGITHQGSKKHLLGSGHDREEEKALVSRYSIEKQVRPDTPPTFIALSADDQVVPIENSFRYCTNLQAMNIPVEMHLFPTGNHGWGFRTRNREGKNCDRLGYARNEFSALLSRWLESQRLICIK